MSDAAAALPTDPGELIRTRQYRVLLVFAGIIGVLVSVADAPNNTRTFTYRAEDVHDFAFSAWDQCHELSARTDEGVAVLDRIRRWLPVITAMSEQVEWARFQRATSRRICSMRGSSAVGRTQSR